MSLTFTLKTAGSDATDRATYSDSAGGVGTFALVAGRLYLAAVVNSKSSAPNAVSSITINGESFAITHATNGTGIYDANKKRLSLWKLVAAGSSPASSSIAFGATQTGCIWHFVEVNGEETTTPIVQTVQSIESDGNPGVALAAFGAAGNAGFAAVGINDNLAVTNRSSWTELADTLIGSAPVCALETQYRVADDDASATSSASESMIIAIEIAVAVAAGGGWGPLLSSGRNRLVAA